MKVQKGGGGEEKKVEEEEEEGAAEVQVWGGRPLRDMENGGQEKEEKHRPIQEGEERKMKWGRDGRAGSRRERKREAE